MENGASKRYAETLRVLRANLTTELLYEVHHPGQEGFQHGYQLHGYIDGLLLRHLQSQGFPFFYETKLEIKYLHLVPDNAKLRFLYRQTGIKPDARREVVSFEYRVHVADQEDSAKVYFTANLRCCGPAENFHRNG